MSNETVERLTHLASLHLNNDENLYRGAQLVTIAALHSAADWSDRTGHPVADGGRVRAGEAIKLWVQDMQPQADYSDAASSMFGDLLSAALAWVDWSEVADGFIESVDTDEL